jgi:hypothetical protein
MKFANATNPNRKSGVAQWRDLQFSQPATDPDGSTDLPFVIPTQWRDLRFLFPTVYRGSPS